MTKNPLDSIQDRLEAIEACLSKLDNSIALNNNDGWERGIEVACEVFQVSNIVILQNLGDIPHFKLCHIIYFNRKVLSKGLHYNQSPQGEYHGTNMN